MTESEYIIATNRVKISAALTLLRDVVPGHGICEYTLQAMKAALIKAEADLFDRCVVDDGKEEK